MSKLAIFHDRFVDIKGGGEMMILDMVDELGADLWTLSYSPDIWSQDDYFSNRLQKLISEGRFRYLSVESSTPLIRRIERNKIAKNTNLKELEEYDNIIFSGDIPYIANRLKKPNKILYCHTPPRILTDQRNDYLKSKGFLKSLFKSLTNKELNRYTTDLSGYSKIYTNSNNTKRRLLRYCGYDSEILYPPIDTSKYYHGEDQGYYLYIGRLDKLKRIELTLKTFSHTGDKLIIVGDGPDKELVDKYASSNDNIEYRGLVSEQDKLELISNCRAGVYLPVNEDFGIVPIEFMSAGKPVIGSNEGGLRETIIDGVAGYLIEPTQECLRSTIKKINKGELKTSKKACMQQAKKFDKTIFYNALSNSLI